MKKTFENNNKFAKHKLYTAIFVIFMASIIVLTACTRGNNEGIKNSKLDNESKVQATSEPGHTIAQTTEPMPSASQTSEHVNGNEPVEPDEKVKDSQQQENSGNDIDETIAKHKPNEAGKIMVVMFHNFVEEYKSGDKYYTTTFSDFKKLLRELYDKNYRLISMREFLNNDINVPAGCIPIVFTFDDGTSGQFNLIRQGDKLVANKNSAVGIMEEFYNEHPDFGLKGTFYVNLGVSTFKGEGTLQERLQYLVDKGFEIGNHTYTHINLKKASSAELIQKEIGMNQKVIQQLIPGYVMETLSMPYGLPSKNLQEYVYRGKFEDITYEHKGIMEVGWDPSVSPIHKNFNPLSVHRVRASGIVPVDTDLGWWLSKLSKDEQYVSDGDPRTVTVPEKMAKYVDEARLKGRNIKVYK